MANELAYLVNLIADLPSYVWMGIAAVLVAMFVLNKVF
jgi:hypothetical protein